MISHKNRGGFLERVIHISNKQYAERNLALIQKIPTPTSINTRKGTARYSEKSTVDFTGVSLGTFIAFDAKETRSKNFPFNRLQPHQRTYLKDAYKQKGEAFILILFTQTNALYKLSIKEYEELKQTLDRKSIPLKWFEENKRDIKSKNGVYYDYLNIADKYY
ncbi:Holliday junction resolvase RecU [Staphylococcus pettenkoferi]|uniref:Holliday junction resolvase RecU n=1 Tax=Staphylococcus pettenkoferi TaxID=170573 RepID=UPI0022755CCE|nr:Holliday junction resolvase RecU [Staphylococcus pettenkoferi]MCY1563839.1 Holliday junction resolvase RecU [Staphylococcus pettenkoferi]